MDIYWIKDKQRRGPATVPDVISLIRLGELSPDTKGWHAGVEGWKPLKDLPALADFLHEPEIPAGLPPLPTEEEKEAAATEKERREPLAPEMRKLDINLPGGNGEGKAYALPSAGIRLLARLVDTGLYLALATGVLFALKTPYNDYAVPGSPLFWFPLVLLEAFCVCRWRTTPGKWLLGIKVGTLGEDTNMGFGRSFLRAALAFFMGVGMLSFPIMPIMMLISLWFLRRRGITWWDLRALTLPVRQEKQRVFPVLSCIIILYLTLSATGYFVQPWMQPIYERLRKESPETAAYFERLVPDLRETPPAGKSIPQPLDKAD